MDEKTLKELEEAAKRKGFLLTVLEEGEGIANFEGGKYVLEATEDGDAESASFKTETALRGFLESFPDLHNTDCLKRRTRSRLRHTNPPTLKKPNIRVSLSLCCDSCTVAKQHHSSFAVPLSRVPRKKAQCSDYSHATWHMPSDLGLATAHLAQSSSASRFTFKLAVRYSSRR
jgi:hypothetical protein